MKLNKFTVILAILLISILAIGAVSAESVDDSDALAIDDDVGEVQESVESTAVAEDVSAADPAEELSIDETPQDLTIAEDADETVEDAGSTVLGDEPKSYDLDDDTYSKYFKEDGTATEEINESSDYTLNVGTLNNKDIIITYGSNINIVGKDGAGVINNGTITIGDGMTKGTSSITISGLTFTNTNKGAIFVSEYAKDVTIQNNIMNLVGDSNLNPDPYLTVTAITPQGYIDGLYITNNNITVSGDAAYSNGIYSWAYGAKKAPTNFIISRNTFDISSSAIDGSNAAIYVECSDSVIENNVITVDSAGSSCAYGIQIPDNQGTSYVDPLANSPKNVTIKNNTVDVKTQNMAYGISVISFACDASWGMLYQFPLDFVISDNNIFIKSDKGAFGIALIGYDTNITNNNLTVIANSTEEASSVDMLGVGTVAIKINCTASSIDFTDEDLEFGPEDIKSYVLDNNIYTNVEGQLSNDYQNVTFENNIYNIQNGMGQYLIDSNTYDVFFDENGNLKDIMPAGSTVLLGPLSNKNMKINTPLTLKRWDEDDVLYNTAITLVGGAEGTVIYDLIFESDGDEVSISSVIFVKAIDNVTIKNCQIIAYDYDSTIYGIQIAGSDIGCNNINITGNHIEINGDGKYVYGIDVWAYGGGPNANFNVSDNYVKVSGASKAAEAVYLNFIDTIEFKNNQIYTYTSVNGYGVGADTLYNAEIIGNEIYVESDNQMAFGITTTNSENVTFKSNEINVEGEGAVGIGLANDNIADISANTIVATGGNYLSVQSGDYLLGAADAAILNKSGNTNLVIGENTITEYFPFFIDNDNFAEFFNEDGTIKEGSPIQRYSNIVLNNLNGKTMIFDVPVDIQGSSVDSNIIIVPGAEGIRLHDLDMKATVTSGSFALIYAQGVSGVSITNSNFVINCNNDLSGWDMIMPIEIEGSTSDNVYETKIYNNNITVTGSAPYVYGIDAFKVWNSPYVISSLWIYNNNILIDVESSMSEGIYLSGIIGYIRGNNITVSSNNAAYGIGTDGLNNTDIEDNNINVNAGTMAYGITATVSGNNLDISGNVINAAGVGAAGVGISGQTDIRIGNNLISIEAGDYNTITVMDSLGVAATPILEGEGNTGVTIVNNFVEEYLDVKLACSDLTVTAAPSGKGSFKITLKTVDGKALANKEITFSFNNQVIKAVTDANGVAKFSFDLNKAGKYSVSIAYLGDKSHKGAFASAKITINPIKTALTASGKTYLATAKTKSLTVTLKDAKGKALANKKVTFTVNGKTVTATTNAKGVATAKLALTAAKTYTVSIKFAGDSVYAASTKSVKVKLNKEKTKVTAPKKTFKKSKKVKKVVVTLKNSKGKAIAKKKVTLTVNKKKYTAKTNKKGKATFKIKNLKKKGTKKYTVKFAGDTQYKACKKTGKIKIK